MVGKASRQLAVSKLERRQSPPVACAYRHDLVRNLTDGCNFERPMMTDIPRTRPVCDLPRHGEGSRCGSVTGIDLRVRPQSPHGEDGENQWR